MINNGDFWNVVGIQDEKIRIHTPQAEAFLREGLRHFVGDNYEWLPEYDKIVEWLSDNKGRGLLCAGNCGRGKTVICQKILPAIFQGVHHLIMNTVTATGLNEHFDEFKQYKIISIDDVGTESIANRFGEKRHFFQEIVDEAERKQKLLIISTNLNSTELNEKYDIRTIDRLRALTDIVLFVGQSLRK